MFKSLKQTFTQHFEILSNGLNIDTNHKDTLELGEIILGTIMLSVLAPFSQYDSTY
jgi:hypothetical protein